MMKRDSNSILYLLIVALAILAILAVPVSAKKLATPVVIMPPNNFQSYDFAGTTLFAWKPVPGAIHYWVVLQHYNGTDWNVIHTANKISPGIWIDLLEPSLYRWSVSANASNQADTSNPSAWRNFQVIAGSDTMKLATPVQIGPAAGTTFFHTSRDIVVYWKPVFGANQYVVNFQNFDTITKTWKNLITTSPKYTGTQFTACHYTIPDVIPGPVQCRWNVMASDSTKAWLNSTPSAWRTFTFKN